jgi:riboflavin kinase/FMN adenylyltransferase
MEVYEDFRGLKERYPTIALSLGNFDGVHLGHRHLIRELVRIAEEVGATPVVFTFDPHPAAVLSPNHAPPLLLTREAKERFLGLLGVKVLICVPFTVELARLSPEDFVREVLCRELAVREVIVGYNFTFGHRGAGRAADLQRYGMRYGFGVHIVPPVEVDGQVVSSTLIRNLLGTGDVERARQYLGYSPFVEGLVVAGDQRGRILGFPTANVAVPANLLLPANGVYAVRVILGDEVFWGVANVGTRPTFVADRQRPGVEVHVLDFAGNLYGRWIKVMFVQRLRAEQKFRDPAELVAQIRRDIDQVRAMRHKNAEGSI